MTDLQMLGHSANLAWYRRSKDLVPLFDPKVHLFENRLWTSCNDGLIISLSLGKEREKHNCDT